MNATDFIFMKFTGCTASKNIGTLYCTISISIEPNADVRGILNVTPRGSYEGVFRVTKQCRKDDMRL